MSKRCVWVLLFALTGLAAADDVPVLTLPGGTSDYAQTPHTADLGVSAERTFELWIHPTQWRDFSSREKYGLVLFFKGLLGSHIDYSLKLERDGWFVYGTTREGSWLTRPIVPLHQWTHFALTYNTNPRRMNLYLNGVRVPDFDAGPLTSFVLQSGNPLYIGGFWQRGWGWNNNNFIGHMADVRIWNVERTGAQIAESMGQTLRGDEQGLIAYWDFAEVQEKDGNRYVPDLSGSGHTLQLQGGASVTAAEVPLQVGGRLDVEFTEPQAGAAYSAGSDIPLAVTVADPDEGEVHETEFFAGDDSIGESETAPYEIVWSNAPAGHHIIRAEARGLDLEGGELTGSAELRLGVHGPFRGAPATLPGWVEAEDFDLGGPGLGYEDTTAANQGGEYRMAEGVDIAAGGEREGYVVGWTCAGEWVSYLVDAPTAGLYSVDARVAAQGAGGAIRFELNGEEVTGPIDIPDTGAWTSYETLTRHNVPFPQGVSTMRVVMASNGSSGFVGAFDAFAVGVTAPPVQQAYPEGIPLPVPGRIAFAHYDEGGMGLAYSDTSADNLGGAYRLDEAVDIVADPESESGHIVGWTQAGEWLEYSLDVDRAGVYHVEVRASADGAGGQFEILAGGESVGEGVNMPDTGAWNQYTVIDAGDAELPAGPLVVRVEMVGEGSNGAVAAFDWMRFTRRVEPVIIHAGLDPEQGLAVQLDEDLSVVSVYYTPSLVEPEWTLIQPTGNVHRMWIPLPDTRAGYFRVEGQE